MTVALAPSPVFQGIGFGGLPLPGGKLFTYVAGTSTPQATYVDSTQTTPNTNPVILNSNGQANVWFVTTQIYKVILQDQFGNQIYSVDQIPGGINAAQVIAVLTQQNLGSVLFPTSQAETNTGVTVTNAGYPYNNILRYGIVPNSPAAAGANTTILRALFNQTIANGPTGKFIFPNTTGSDAYYFNGTCAMRDGINIDLQECIINFTGATTVNDVNCGLFYALRDFSLQNGTINTTVDTTLGSQGGSAVALGARGIGFYFTVFDASLPIPMGNIVLRNLRINVNNTTAPNNSGNAIAMLGGLVNVIVENIVINMNSLGTSLEAINYEWGWATSPIATATTQTSHAHNMAFRNIKLINCAEIAMALVGCYNCSVEGLKTINCQRAFDYDPGEAMFTVPWAGVDDVGAKRTMTLRDIVAEGCTATAVTLTGSKLASGTYQASFGRTAAQQTDLMTFNLDGFSLQSTGGCLNISGDATITNGKCDANSGGSDSIIVTNDALNVTFSNVKALNSVTASGLRANIAGIGVWSPERNKFITYTDGQIAGNLVGANMGNIEVAYLARNRIGYSSLYDGVGNEATQATGVQCGTSVTGVTCDSNFSTPSSGGTAYVVVGSPTDRVGNNLVNPLNVSTISGSWDLQGQAQSTATNLASKTSSVNTINKYTGRQCYNTSTNKMFIAQGAVNTSTWISVDGATTVTPS